MQQATSRQEVTTTEGKREPGDGETHRKWGGDIQFEELCLGRWRGKFFRDVG